MAKIMAAFFVGALALAFTGAAYAHHNGTAVYCASGKRVSAPYKCRENGGRQ
jgi:hypothetical protein